MSAAVILSLSWPFAFVTLSRNPFPTFVFHESTLSLADAFCYENAVRDDLALPT
jgi:hypothetical protein